MHTYFVLICHLRVCFLTLKTPNAFMPPVPSVLLFGVTIQVCKSFSPLRDLPSGIPTVCVTNIYERVSLYGDAMSTSLRLARDAMITKPRPHASTRLSTWHLDGEYFAR